MCDIYSTVINKLMVWKTGKWVKYEVRTSKIVLRVHFDQLLITDDNKILESLNFSGKMKGIYKEDVLILIICNRNEEIRKLKFQVNCNPVQCFTKLGEYFPVINHNCSNSETKKFQYRNIDEVLKTALSSKGIISESITQMSENYKNFVKMCLLDPSFLQIVMETEKLLLTEMKQ